MDGWGFASFKVIIGFHKEGRKGAYGGSQPTLTLIIAKDEIRDLGLSSP